MLNWLICCGSSPKFRCQAGEDLLVGLGVVDLVACSLFVVHWLDYVTPRVVSEAETGKGLGSQGQVFTSVRASSPKKAMRAPSLQYMLCEYSATYGYA